MKLQFLLLLASFYYINGYDQTSKSFFSQSGTTHFLFNKKDFFQEKLPVSPSKKPFLKVSAFCSRSTHPKKLATYFGPFAKASYTVKEAVDSADVNQGGQDIMSYNFNIVTNDGDFESTVSFKPSWVSSGFNCNFLFNLQKHSWLMIDVPFMYVSTNMHLKESIISAGNGSVKNLGGGNFTIDQTIQASSFKQAMAEKNMGYGKINGAQKKAGIAHIKTTFGYDFRNSKRLYLQPYIGLSLPCGNKPKAEYMFEPIVGNNKHVELFSGFYWGHSLADYDQLRWRVVGLCQTTYKCANTQIRSFDPGAKPWGRYLAVASSPQDLIDQTYKWGIKEFTKQVKVRPHFSWNNQINLVFEKSTYSYSLGYSTQVYTGETVELYDDWKRPAISSLVAANTTVPARGINNVLDNTRDSEYLSVKKYELNLDSAAHNYHADHTIMACADWTIGQRKKSVNCNAGAAYTFGTTNQTMNNWALWFTIATQF